MTAATAAKSRELAPCVVEEASLRLFYQIDTNHNGYISRTEMKKFLENEPWVANLLTEKTANLREFLSKIDEDGDGVMTEEEFTKFYISEIHQFVEEVATLTDLNSD